VIHYSQPFFFNFMRPLDYFRILGGDVGVEIGKVEKRDISIAFNALNAYDKNRLAHIYTAVSL
jgi:hypothetical protein